MRVVFWLMAVLLLLIVGDAIKIGWEYIKKRLVWRGDFDGPAGPLVEFAGRFSYCTKRAIEVGLALYTRCGIGERWHDLYFT
jgi:hypothetical protein